MNATAKQIYDRMSKVIKWTCKAEAATTRKQARKALRKVAKHNLKLAHLEGMAYTERAQEEDTND